MRIRKIAIKVLTSALRRVDESHWHDTGEIWTRDKPVRFANRQTFSNFLDGAFQIAEGFPEVRFSSVLQKDNNTKTLALNLSEKSEHARSNVILNYSTSDSETVQIQFIAVEKRRLGAPTVQATSRIAADAAMRLIEDHSIPATRRDHRAGRQLVDPVTTEADLLRREVRESGQRSTFWAVSAGIASGIIAQIVGALAR